MPSIKKRLRMVETWPLPHRMGGSFSMEFDNAVIDSTILPICHYDEGNGAPDSYNSHPQNASFTVANDSNCFVDSRINSVFCKLEFSITSKFLDENIQPTKIGVMPIFMAFKEDYDATDEITGTAIKTILGMEYETTDRQGRPIFNGTKMAEKYAGSNDLWDATGLGLTTDIGMEGVTFNIDTYYDALQYYTIAGKLKSVQGGLKWFTLSRSRPKFTYMVKIRPKVKRMNEYAFLGVGIHGVAQNSDYQHGVDVRDFGDAIQYVDCDWQIRYLEWNDLFDHGKV